MELASYGDLAVQLVNTVNPDVAGSDRLTTVDELLELVGDPPRWRRRAGERDVAELQRLRARLRVVFERADTGDESGAVGALNELLERAVIRPQVSGHDREPWHLHLASENEGAATAYTAAAVMGLAVQLTETGVDRFGVCQAPPCRNVFVDTSTNRSRRYCSERCATRANVAAYRARRRAQPATAAAGLRPSLLSGGQ